MNEIILLDEQQLKLTINRLCFQLIENHTDFSNSCLIGLQPRGSNLASVIYNRLKELTGNSSIQFGLLDASFHRDDFRRRNQPISVNNTQIDFLVEDQKVILIDDVLYTGRSIRAALDALMAFGRPKSVEFLVLIDRRFSRQLPIQADYIGRTVDSIASERVDVIWSDSNAIVKLNTMAENEQ